MLQDIAIFEDHVIAMNALGGNTEPGIATGTAGVGAGVGPTGTTGGGITGHHHRGPVRAAEDAALAGGTGVGTGTTGGGLTGRHGVGAGTGAGAGTVGGTTAGTGAGYGTAAAGVRPPVGQRIAGETEKFAGQVLGNPVMVARGQEKKVRPCNVG